MQALVKILPKFSSGEPCPKSIAKDFIALQYHGKGCSVAFRDIRRKQDPPPK
ncbi:MAG: hypothetical protein ACI8W8_001155 [Rhodothermales bacterium]|jgi:hypothetical protein